MAGQKCPAVFVLGGCRDCLLALEALPAEYRAALSGLKRDGGFAAAVRALGHGFHPSRPAGRVPRSLCFACLATLRLILESLVVEEMLFTRGEYKIRTAIHAGKLPILELCHSPVLPDSAKGWYRVCENQPFVLIQLITLLPGGSFSGSAYEPKPA